MADDEHRSPAGLVDWALAGRVARGVAKATGEAAPLDGTTARGAGAEALDRVLSYTGLTPVLAVPEVEVVSRAQWIAANLADLGELAAPLEERAAGELPAPGPLGGLVRGAVGAAGGVEAGALVGYAARRVLGQYQVALGPRPKPQRMLLVGQNVAEVARELGVDQRGFLLWVAIHEQTHAVQFTSVPWLREHLAQLVARLIAGASGSVDFAELVRSARGLVTRDPRRALRAALRGELTRALAGPQQAGTLDEVQAVMAVIEGHAEHVMDAASSDDEGLAVMRRRMDERRAATAGLADLIARALGLGMKLRQYELGKAWADGVVDAAGSGALNRAWEGPESLPSLAELERPRDWLARVTPASVAGGA